jgi:hypothetical protein
MTANTDEVRPGSPAAAESWAVGEPAAADNPKQHFDTFETHFFQQGDEVGQAPGQDLFEEIDRSARATRPWLSRPSLIGIATLSSALAFLACVALGKSNAPAALATTPVAHVAKAAPAPVPVAPAVAGPTAPAAAEPVAAIPAPAAPAAPEPAAAPEATAAAGAAEQPTPAKGELAEPQSGAQPALANDTSDRCKQAIQQKRGKQILAMCPAAFAEDTTDATIAVALAKVEFDRSHFTQAHTWARKAIAINPASAEAYVFAGGAEQSQGHGKAAKESYLNYLRLAPSGRYAAELRTIVNSL